MLLFTSCTLLTLSVDLVGGMSTCEAPLPFTNLATPLSFTSHLSSKIICVFCLDILQEN